MNLGSASSFNHLYKIINNKERFKEQENERLDNNKLEKPKINYFSAKLIKFVNKLFLFIKKKRRNKFNLIYLVLNQSNF